MSLFWLIVHNTGLKNWKILMEVSVKGCRSGEVSNIAFLAGQPRSIPIPTHLRLNRSKRYTRLYWKHSGSWIFQPDSDIYFSRFNVTCAPMPKSITVNSIIPRMSHNKCQLLENLFAFLRLLVFLRSLSLSSKLRSQMIRH